MKGISILILGLFFYVSYGQVNSVNELNIKVNKIRVRLLNGNTLPATIINLDSLTFPKHDSIHHDYGYYTTRIENSIIDSVRMHLMIRTNDSLMDLNFDEDHLSNGKEIKSFHYSVNKYGVIDYAYREEPLEDSKVPPKVILKGEHKVLVPNNQKTIFEINSNSHNPALKNPDKKILEMYNARLKKSVDELYYVLFK